jgi:TolB protein
MPDPALPQRLTTSLHHKQHLRYAPDGSYLVYARTIGPRITLMKVPVQGGEEHVLLPDRNDYIQQHPVWSPDRKRFAFTANDGHRNLRIGILLGDVSGSGIGNFRPWLMAGQDSNASWSSDGRQVAFIAGNQHLMIANADGTGRRRLGPPSGISQQPHWSPAGDRIAFSSSHEGTFAVYTARPDGSALTRLTRSSRADYRPVFSPDGLWLAFTSARAGHGRIYLMRSDGSGPRCLTPYDAAHDHAAWSPDGRQLAFISTRDGGYDVYRVPIA